MKYFIYLVILLVALAVVGGFFIVGSPQEERLRRFDQRRVNDLQVIQSQIINYWTKKSQLPENLVALTDDISGFVTPIDPETGEEYLYEIKDTNNLTFSLCANFARPSFGSLNDPYLREKYPVSFNVIYEQNWQHDAGLVCFERTIDKDFYKPEKSFNSIQDEPLVN